MKKSNLVCCFGLVNLILINGDLEAVVVRIVVIIAILFTLAVTLLFVTIRLLSNKR
jgi:hypothetical protein